MRRQQRREDEFHVSKGTVMGVMLALTGIFVGLIFYMASQSYDREFSQDTLQKAINSQLPIRRSHLGFKLKINKMKIKLEKNLIKVRFAAQVGNSYTLYARTKGNLEYAGNGVFLYRKDSIEYAYDAPKKKAKVGKKKSFWKKSLDVVLHPIDSSVAAAKKVGKVIGNTVTATRSIPVRTVINWYLDGYEVFDVSEDFALNLAVSDVRLLPQRVIVKVSFWKGTKPILFFGIFILLFLGLMILIGLQPQWLQGLEILGWIDFSPADAFSFFDFF